MPSTKSVNCLKPILKLRTIDLFASLAVATNKAITKGEAHVPVMHRYIHVLLFNIIPFFIQHYADLAVKYEE